MKKKCKDQLEKEELDRKELLLNELKEWANNLRYKANEIACQRTEKTSPIPDIQAIGHIYADLVSNVEFKKYTMPYFSALAREINADLGKSVEDVCAKILDLINISSQLNESVDKSAKREVSINDTESEGLIDKLKSSTTDSNKYVDKLYQEIAKAKLALLKQQ